ncbi:DUF2231 domain-containing protein [Polluticoccus soli]|uniref:DUF2231 domain-containing protein n=1 Tax=Polluticoccus soli TaxID=3034150 RepID=UPI0023E1349C|nr:DUF2231 domain-containing protein [Flavipsychrobacter sp. JY13-12]
MKSKANFKSHPLHPILVAFPIAFFVGTLVFDMLFVMNNNEEHLLVAKYLNLAGIIGAILAAIPGIIDYFATVPPNSSAKTRATKHGLLNSTVLLIFLVIYLMRDNNTLSLLHLSLEIVAIVVLTIAGWMGGTLVYRNQIGVDIRYAGAGKWNEASFSEQQNEVQVASIGEISLNQMKLVHLNGKRIVIAQTEKGFVAFDDRCSHKGGTLAGGSMICGTVQCPWHGSQFNVATGDVNAGPAKSKIKTYDLRVEGNKILLKP